MSGAKGLYCRLVGLANIPFRVKKFSGAYTNVDVPSRAPDTIITHLSAHGRKTVVLYGLVAKL
jgi:hypothetical protein